METLSKEGLKYKERRGERSIEVEKARCNDKGTK
jgi:hypothetical protein